MELRIPTTGTVETTNCLPEGLEKEFISIRIAVLSEPFPFFLTAVRECKPFNNHTFQGLLCDAKGSQRLPLTAHVSYCLFTS